MKLCIILLLISVSVNCQYLNETTKHGNVIRNPCTDRHHLVLAPGVLAAGGSSRVCISRFYTHGPARVKLSLLTEDRQTTTALRELPPGDGGCLDVNAPLLPNTKADLLVNIRYPEVQCTWERRITLRIESARVVAIATERARYKRGEWMRFRILALKPDVTPSNGLIEDVWLEGPRGAWEGSRVTQWDNVRTRMGLAQLQYQIDELAPVGKWTVKAKMADGSQGSTEFWVGDYELPPFQLSVRHMPKVLRTSEKLVWSVCVRYPWSEAVKGMLVIRLRGAGASGGVRTAVQIRAPKPCHRHAVAAKRLGLGGDQSPDVIVADFSFQEGGTRIWQNTTVVSQVVDKRVSLEFLTKHKAILSHGLPYKIKVKATRWDDKPASKEVVRVCRYPTIQPNEMRTSSDMCTEASTDDTGIAAVMFTLADDAAPFYKFEAFLGNETTSSASLVVGASRGSRLSGALGPLKPDSTARTLVPLYLNARNISTAITVHFVVITRGGIIYRWGATTQCPITSTIDQPRAAPRNGPCNSYYVTSRDLSMAPREDIGYYDDMPKRIQDYKDPTSGLTDANTSSDWLVDRQQSRVLLPVKVSHQMCPGSNLIAYFYYEGELVSASKQFEMEECFGIKAEAIWLTRQVQPGSPVSLQVSTPGPAICALTVLDIASKWTQPPPTAREIVMSGLRKLIDSHKNLTEYEAAGECFLNSDTPIVPTTSIEMISTWLAGAGIRLLGGDRLDKKPCEPQLLTPAPLISEEAPTLRSDFSEAWLWRLLAVGNNGSGIATARAPDSITRYEANAVCVSRNGVAIAPPATLQVFREFFIHADSPKRLRRGDSTIIRYRIFNYLFEPLSVQVQILTDSDLEGPVDQVESLCVKARSSSARRVEIKARGSSATSAKLRLRARSVSDNGCGNMTTGKNEVSDEVLINITIEPEGIPVHEQKSILLCDGNGTAETYNTKVQWTWPPVDAVPGTESLTVWAVGDIIGPMLTDADSLLTIPRGCGEQNMAQLAINLLALTQLDSTSLAASTAREHVARGFTRQLQYVHPAGGFSAFGASDAAPSTWLTAFAVRYLRRAHTLLWPNLPAPPAVIRAERWLINQQMENGCFRNEGQVFHRELRGGLSEEGEIASVGLTAYVITSLMESTAFLPHRIIKNTLSCLRAFPPLKAKSPTRVYAHSLLAYAFMMMDKYEDDLWKTNEAGYLKKPDGMLEVDEGMRHLMDLLKIARRSGDYLWWEASSLSTSIEATSYAMLAMRVAGARQEWGARGAAAGRWLAAHSSASGGFVSTQDTLVALEALTAWTDQTPHTHMNVTARCSGLDKTVTLEPGVKIPDVMKMRPGERLSINVEGTGCALIQATRSYNVLTPKSSPQKQLYLQMAVHTDGQFDCDEDQRSCSCAAVVTACILWSGVFPEMVLMEVLLPGGFRADAQLLYSQLNKPNSLLRRIELTPSNTRVTLYLGSRDGSDTIARGGHQCYDVHSVGPSARTKPAYARLQDYYNPEVNDTQVFTIPEDCPPRIVHETNPYESSVNLFAKSRSAESDEILITHEFSYEDIPDGIIPLEDPLYENLTKKDKNNQNVDDKNKNNVNSDSKAVLSESRTFIDTKEAPNHVTNNIFKNTNDKILESNTSKVEKHSDSRLIPSTEINSNKSPNYEIKPAHDKIETDSHSVSVVKHKDNVVLDPKTPITNKEAPVFIAKEDITNQNKEKHDTTKKITKRPTVSEKIVAKPVTNQGIYPVHSELSSETGFRQITKNKMQVDNPNLSEFHVIDSEKDLEVPTGVEGPVPTIVLPPPNFVMPPNDYRRLQSVYTPYGPYSYLTYDDNVYNRRYFQPAHPRYYPQDDLYLRAYLQWRGKTGGSYGHSPGRYDQGGRQAAEAARTGSLKGRHMWDNQFEK